MSRPRLLERLNAGLDRKLTLISAPAGFGKTTLLSEWVASSRPRARVAWLSLDEGDNDLAGFLAYLIAALQKVEAEFGKGALSALQSPQPSPTEAILTGLINELAAIPDQIVVVLDDYHVIESQPIDKALTFLLDHLPSQMHLVIASRIDPSMPLSRLRARGQMTEIRVRDLRFSSDEAAAFLNQVMGFELSTQDVVALEERTEGWIAGLYLAGLSMQGLKRKDDIADFVNRFTGSDHYIQDYLTDEVLQQRPEGTRDFLLQTSILNRLSAQLCDAVTGMSDSQGILESLEASNLFIMPLDNERCWYRYHHLFADLLQSRLKRFYPDRLTILHLRAVEWFEKNGLVDEAVGHAFSARDYDRAADLIEQVTSETMLHGRLNTILQWLDALPEGMLDTRPRLHFYQAWALSIAGQPRIAEKILLDAKSSLDNLPDSPENRTLRGEMAAILTGIITTYNDPPRVIQEGEEALTYLPEENQVSRARVYMALGTAYANNDEIQKAMETYQTARDLALSAKNPFLAAVTIELFTDMQIYHQGRLKDAAQNLAKVLELGRSMDGSHQPFTGLAHSLLGEINLEWNNLKAASRYLDRGIELIQQGGIDYALTHTYCAKARLELALGETDRAVEALQIAKQASQAPALAQFLIHNLAYQVRLALYLGDTKTAFRWATGDMCELPEGLPTYLHEIQQISLAQVYLAQADLENAIETLDRIHPQAESASRMAHIINIYLLKALALQEQGKSDAAIECLESSLSLAAPEGYIRTFVDRGEPMAQLLHHAAARGTMPDYTARLLAAFEGTTKDERKETEIAPRSIVRSPSLPIEPLSPRELQILQLIAQGLSNREISERLFLALDTVKGHNYRIYSKLGVSSRTQAVNKALSLKIILPQ